MNADNARRRRVLDADPIPVSREVRGHSARVATDRRRALHLLVLIPLVGLAMWAGLIVGFALVLGALR